MPKKDRLLGMLRSARMLEGRRVLITGGAGFIGTSLARRLVDANQVVLFDNLHRNALAGSELANEMPSEAIASR